MRLALQNVVGVTGLVALFAFPSLWAEEVKYADVLLNPPKYIDKTVTLTGKFQYKISEREAFDIEQGDYSIEIFFSQLPEKSRAVILSARDFSRQTVIVTGILKKYADAKNTYYIIASNVDFLDAPSLESTSQSKRDEPRPDPSRKAEFVSLRELELNKSKYIDKDVSVRGRLSVTAYYNYGYRDAQESHFAFDLQADNASATLYWQKDAARDVKNALLTAESLGRRSEEAIVTFRISREKYDPDATEIVGEIIRAELEIPDDSSASQKIQGAELFAVVQNGDFLAVKRVLSQGADPNARNDQGMTALMIASEKGYASIVRALIMHGASAYETSKDGLSALSLAESSAHAQIVEILKSAQRTVTAPKIVEFANLREIEINPSGFIGKDVTVRGRLSLSTYYNYGYQDAESSHYSFGLTAGDTSAALYWRKGAADAIKDELLKLEQFNQQGVEHGADARISDAQGKTALDYAKTPAITGLLNRATR